jgi:hypothetical protein
MHDPREIGMLELPWRKIDGHFIGSRPGRRFAAGGSQHPFADWDNEAAFLSDGDELAGQDQTMLGMMPANQGFEPHYLNRRDPHLGLVVELELVLQ